ncbi:hypothetical protein DV736_g1023, partial [Chaetothyriales sp. CBS 134916]
LTFYPFYTFSSSPTFNTWAKLTCHTIQHELRASSSFPSRLLRLDDDDGGDKHRLLLFYLNHPIQYVQVTGVIVSIDEHHLDRHQCQLTILSLDDSSGATVDVLLPDLAPGTVFRAKGSLSQFRGRRQVRLLRGEVIGSTGAEMGLVSARGRFYSSVLAKPWVISARRMAGLKQRATRAHEDLERARRRRADRERRHADSLKTDWDRDEVERATEAEVARSAGEEVRRQQWKKKRRTDG